MRRGSAQSRDTIVHAVPAPDGGDQFDSTPLTKDPQWAAVRPPWDLAQNGVRRVGADSRELQGSRIAPHGVVIPGPQDHRAIGDRLVQPAGIEQSTRCQTAVIGGTDNPFTIGIRLREALHLGHDLGHTRAAAHLWPGVFQPTEERMRVTVSECRHEKTASQVDHVCEKFDRHCASHITESDHATVVDQHGGFVVLPDTHPNGTTGEKLRVAGSGSPVIGMDLGVTHGGAEHVLPVHLWTFCADDT